MPSRVAIKTVRVMGPDLLNDEEPSEFDQRNQIVVDSFSWSFIEETVNDLLPEGYFCKIEDA